ISVSVIIRIVIAVVRITPSKAYIPVITIVEGITPVVSIPSVIWSVIKTIITAIIINIDRNIFRRRTPGTISVIIIFFYNDVPLIIQAFTAAISIDISKNHIILTLSIFIGGGF